MDKKISTRIEVTLFPGTKMRQMHFYDSDGELKHVVTGGEEIEGMPVGSKWLCSTPLLEHAGEMRNLLRAIKYQVNEAIIDMSDEMYEGIITVLLLISAEEKGKAEEEGGGCT